MRLRELTLCYFSLCLIGLDYCVLACEKHDCAMHIRCSLFWLIEKWVIFNCPNGEGRRNISCWAFYGHSEYVPICAWGFDLLILESILTYNTILSSDGRWGNKRGRQTYIKRAEVSWLPWGETRRKGTGSEVLDRCGCLDGSSGSGQIWLLVRHY